MTETPRDQQIIDLLRHMRDLQGTSTSGTGQRDGGDRILHNPGGQWEQTGCDKLDQLLSQMREDRPAQWWAVTQRYVECDSRPRIVTATRTHSGRLVMPKRPCGPHSETIGEGIRIVDSLTANAMRVVVETWRPEVRNHKVHDGIRYLSTRFPFNNYKHHNRDSVAA